MPFALDAKARLAALERTHAFDSVEHLISAWSLILDPDQTAALYATYSNINIRPHREAVLTELGRVARDEFHGRVTPQHGHNPIHCPTSALIPQVTCRIAPRRMLGRCRITRRGNLT